MICILTESQLEASYHLRGYPSHDAMAGSCVICTKKIAGCKRVCVISCAGGTRETKRRKLLAAETVFQTTRIVFRVLLLHLCSQLNPQLSKYILRRFSEHRHPHMWQLRYSVVFLDRLIPELVFRGVNAKCCCAFASSGAAVPPHPTQQQLPPRPLPARRRRTKCCCDVATSVAPHHRRRP